MMSSTSTLVISGLPKNLGMISLPYIITPMKWGSYLESDEDVDLVSIIAVTRTQGAMMTLFLQCKKVLTELRGTDGKRLDLLHRSLLNCIVENPSRSCLVHMLM